MRGTIPIIMLCRKLGLRLTILIILFFSSRTLADMALEPITPSHKPTGLTADSLKAPENSEQSTVKENAVDDPCLPPLYNDWEEFSSYSEDYRRNNNMAGARIVIDLVNFRMVLEAVIRDGTTRAIIEQNIAVGDPKTPTPVGSFIMNHIYCYPDVLFFGDGSTPVHGLYNGFFAPLLVCDENANCRRFNELGLHGYHATALTSDSVSMSPSTFGALSAGCVRISDPCSFKMELIRVVGIGPLKKNDRGSYHWLKKPVQVVVKGEESPYAEGETIASILKNSISNLGDQFSHIFNWLNQ